MKTSKFLLLCFISVFVSCKQYKNEAILPKPIKIELVLTKLWETDTLKKTCEAVRYDKNKNIIYVSNMGNVPTDAKDGDGSLSILSTDGKTLNQNWVIGLHAPKGANYYNDKLYVADIDAIVKVDIKSGKVEKTIVVDKAIFLNDVDIDTNGDVYITDSRDSKIYKLVNDEVSLWLDLAGFNPNGILVEKNRILIASFSKGEIIAIDKNTKEQTVVAIGVPKGDGIVPIKQGYIVSSWPGEIYFVDKNFPGASGIKLLDTQEEKLNAADISIIPKDNILLIPTFYGNKVVAYKINSQL